MVQAAECMCKGPEAAVCWVSWRSFKKFITSGREARGGGGRRRGRNRGPSRTSPRLSEDLKLGGKSTAGSGGLNQRSDGPDSRFEVLVALDGHCSGVGSHRELQKFR